MTTPKLSSVRHVRLDQTSEDAIDFISQRLAELGVRATASEAIRFALVNTVRGIGTTLSVSGPQQ
jgi:hypothetical protein